MLLGSYSRAKPHQVEIYTAGIVATLADYSREVVWAVTDPRSSLCLQRKLKWLPEIADCVEACEAAERRLAFEEHQRLKALEPPKQLEPPRDPEKDGRMLKKIQALLGLMKARKPIPPARDPYWDQVAAQ